MKNLFRKIKNFVSFFSNTKSCDNNQLNPSEALIRIIQNTEAQNVLAGLAETGIDSCMQNGAYRDIPILNSLIGPIRVFFSVRDYFFIKKLIIFLNNYESIDSQSKEKFTKQINSDSNYRQFIGEHLVSALDRYSQIEKIEALAKFFAEYINGNISRSEFLRYSYIIETVDWNLIPYLQYFYVKRSIDNWRFYDSLYGVWIDIRYLDYKERLEFFTDLGLPVELDNCGQDLENFINIQNFIFAGLISIDLGKVERGKSDIENGYFASDIVIPASYTTNEFGNSFLNVLGLHIDPIKIKKYFEDKNFFFELDENPSLTFEGIDKIWFLTKKSVS